MSELGDDFCLVCGSPPPLFGENVRIMLAKKSQISTST